jgi:hypothetical protein
VSGTRRTSTRRPTQDGRRALVGARAASAGMPSVQRIRDGSEGSANRRKGTGLIHCCCPPPAPIPEPPSPFGYVASSPDITGPDWFAATSRVTGTIPSIRCGRPEPRFVSTSHVERLNLSVRTHLRRYARRANAHSRKLANHKACVALWVEWYNFVRMTSAIRMTP